MKAYGRCAGCLKREELVIEVAEGKPICRRCEVALDEMIDAHNRRFLDGD